MLELYVDHFGQKLSQNPSFPLSSEIRKLLPQLSPKQGKTLEELVHNHWLLVTDVDHIDYAFYPEIMYKNGQPFTQL